MHWINLISLYHLFIQFSLYYSKVKVSCLFLKTRLIHPSVILSTITERCARKNFRLLIRISFPCKCSDFTGVKIPYQVASLLLLSWKQKLSGTDLNTALKSTNPRWVSRSCDSICHTTICKSFRKPIRMMKVSLCFLVSFEIDIACVF